MTVHHGDPAVLGISDIARPDWGDAVTIREGEIPVFWACGVTSQVAVIEALKTAAVEMVIAHAPGHMFIGDLKKVELAERTKMDTFYIQVWTQGAFCYFRFSFSGINKWMSYSPSKKYVWDSILRGPYR